MRGLVLQELGEMVQKQTGLRVQQAMVFKGEERMERGEKKEGIVSVARVQFQAVGCEQGDGAGLGVLSPVCALE